MRKFQTIKNYKINNLDHEIIKMLNIYTYRLMDINCNSN